MVLWIQKTFHTDKWWGKAIFMLLTYVVYWCVFYGIFSILPNQHPNNNTDVGSSLFLIYLVIIVPILSFFIPHYFKKVFSINKVLLYSLHLFFILVSLYLFFIIAATSAVQNIQIG
ncbi:MAG: hypothetical protein NT068_02110 [Candidatus Nomurabacteria bacterium]|nr:hypothetical protein [Candidatus Nomurabacteria bacterium]